MLESLASSIDEQFAEPLAVLMEKEERTGEGADEDKKLASAFVVKGRAFAGYASEEEMINAAMAHLQSLGSVPTSMQGSPHIGQLGGPGDDHFRNRIGELLGSPSVATVSKHAPRLVRELGVARCR